MPAAEALDGRALRNDRGAGGSQQARRAPHRHLRRGPAREYALAEARSAGDPRRRTRANRRRRSRRSPRDSSKCAARATSCSSTSAAPESSAPLACAAFVPDEDAADALDTDPIPRAKQCAARARDKGIDVTPVHDGGIHRRSRGGAHGARLSAAGICGAAATARAQRSSMCAVMAIACARSCSTASRRRRSRSRSACGPRASSALDALFAACDANAVVPQARIPISSGRSRAIRDAARRRRKRCADRRSAHGQAADGAADLHAVLTGLHPLTYIPELAVTLPEILERGAAGDWSPAVRRRADGACPISRSRPTSRCTTR